MAGRTIIQSAPPVVRGASTLTGPLLRWAPIFWTIFCTNDFADQHRRNRPKTQCWYHQKSVHVRALRSIEPRGYSIPWLINRHHPSAARQQQQEDCPQEEQQDEQAFPLFPPTTSIRSRPPTPVRSVTTLCLSPRPSTRPRRTFLLHRQCRPSAFRQTRFKPGQSGASTDHPLSGRPSEQPMPRFCSSR